jgi:signal peptidase I
MNSKLSKFFKELKSLATLVLIIFLLKVTIVEAYIVPTGSMENTIMTGDFLIGSRFNYGMRTPDWIGIPYTDKGFDIPHFRFPPFKKPQQGDVIIFKYPRDPIYKYVKRCIAGPGDKIRIHNRKVFVNELEYSLPENGKFLTETLPPNFVQRELFLPNLGNKDHIHSVTVPKKGDIISINDSTNWRYLLPIMLSDGHEASLVSGDKHYTFTLIDPNDVFRRKGKRKVYSQYFPQGKLINPWSWSLQESDFQFLQLDGIPVLEWEEYIVEQDYYWAMGDNRDDSLDSRFWGFIPFDYILGEALFTYFSVDLSNWKGVKRSLLNPLEWKNLFSAERLSRIGTILE